LKGKPIQRLTVGQKIVHRRYGAGIVVDRREGKEDEEHKSYYVIDIPSSALKVHVPASAIQEVKLRRISTKRKMHGVLRMLSQPPAELPKDYRERRATVQQSMSDGTIGSLASVLRDLAGLQNVKKSMSTMELALLTSAKRRLAGELALVVSIDLTEAMRAIDDALHKGQDQ